MLNERCLDPICLRKSGDMYNEIVDHQEYGRKNLWIDCRKYTILKIGQ